MYLMPNMNVSHIDPGNALKMSQVCVNRYICELGRLGSKPQLDLETSDFLQRLLWKIALISTQKVFEHKHRKFLLTFPHSFIVLLYASALKRFVMFVPMTNLGYA